MVSVYNKPEAEQDILLAVAWYEEQRAGLGREFLNELEDLYAYIEENPRYFPERSKNIRQASFKKFPYLVIFRLYPGKVVVLAVFNCYQNPKKKKARLR